MADAEGLNPSGRKVVRVRIPPRAPSELVFCPGGQFSSETQSRNVHRILTARCRAAREGTLHWPGRGLGLAWQVPSGERGRDEASTSLRSGSGLRSRVSVPAGGDRGRGPLGTCAMGCRTATSRSCSPNSASTSTTSPCSAGCSASRRCSSSRLGPSVTRSGIGGSWTRPMSGSPRCGATCTGAVDEFGLRRLRLHAPRPGGGAALPRAGARRAWPPG